MTQPKPTIEIRDGVQVERRFYPEGPVVLDEYHEDGCLVMVGAPGIWKGQNSLNVRLDPEFDHELGRPVMRGTFDQLNAVYLRACERHGWQAQDEKKNRAFFEETKGWGVLWAARQKADIQAA